MNLENYKDYFRLYPRIRVSHSIKGLVKYAVKTNDWTNVWKFMIGEEIFKKSKKMHQGSRIHEALEIIGPDFAHFGGYREVESYYRELKVKVVINEYLEIKGIVDLLYGHFLADYKFGTLHLGYFEQLELYWDMLTTSMYQIQISSGGSDYEVITPFGGLKYGKLLQVDKNLNVLDERITIFNMENRGKSLQEMISVGETIKQKIEEGSLDKFLSNK